MTEPVQKQIIPEKRKKLHAKVFLLPEMINAEIVVATQPDFLMEEFAFTHVVDAMKDITQKLTKDNSLEYTERLLLSQSIALNSLFVNLVSKAQAEDKDIKKIETFMRLGLKAQNQCRATMETLAAIKNPPVVYAKTANIAQNQQINHGASPAKDCQNQTRQVIHDQGENIPVESMIKDGLNVK
jgi:hypothetical protein